MRVNYYEFPEGTPEEVLLDAGCGVILKDGQEIFPEEIPECFRHLVDHVNRAVTCRVSWAKKMLKERGGSAWTEHYERDGGCFEVTPITLAGNNTRFRYNHRL